MQNNVFSHALADQADESGKYIHSTVVDFDVRMDEATKAAGFIGVDPVTVFAAGMSMHTGELYEMIKAGDPTIHTPSAWSDIITKHVNDLICLRAMVGQAFSEVKEDDQHTVPYSNGTPDIPDIQLPTDPPKAKDIDYDAPPPGTS